MKKNSFVQGTIIASISLILVKILGALYVIPFYRIIGEEGGTIYSYAYNIYNLFLNISTAGIPIAISMVVSEHNALEEYDAKERAYKIGKKAMALLAICSFLIVFCFSEYISKFLLSGADGGCTYKEVALAIRSISFCLLIIPFLSVLRGYMQGHKFISPSSFSQVLEQVVRIAVILLGSYISINVLNKSVPVGVAISVTGAFFGGLSAYLYLKYKVNKNKQLFPISKVKDKITNKQLLKKIIAYCIPIITIAVVSDLYTITDIKLIVYGLQKIGLSGETGKIISSIVATWAPKICTIIVAVSTALTTNIVPNIMPSFVKKDMKEVNHKFNQAINTMLIITMPISVLLFLLSDYAYYIFYGLNEYGFIILKFTAISHIFVGLQTISNSMLQSMKKRKLIYVSLIAGLVTNAILDIPIILLMNKLNFYPFAGTVIATSIGCITAITIVLVNLKKTMNFNFKDVYTFLLKLILPLILIIVPILIARHYINIEYSIFNCLLWGIIYGTYGMIVYFLVLYKNGALKQVLGEEFINNLLRKLRIKK